MLSYPLAWMWWHAPKDDIGRAVADLLIIGFYGKRAASPSARLLARQAARGQVGAVFFVTQNIGTQKQASELVSLFRRGPQRPRLAIDHEGGVVQRLRPKHGFTRLGPALRMPQNTSAEDAKALYAVAGQELKSFGFDINLAPVLDVHNAENPAIGRPLRAFGTDTNVIADYGRAFIDGFEQAGILCAAKHFPGHGSALDDTHDVPTDITETWTAAELEPFAQLCRSQSPPPIIMVGHLRLDSVDPSGCPAPVSRPIVTGLLRGELGFDGVIMTDDIDMGAISHARSRRDAFVQAIAAGNDLIMIKNLFRFDPLLPQRAIGWVRKAIKAGELTEHQVLEAARRVRSLKG